MLTIPRDLNVYSSGMPPIISLSQYDSDFQLVFNLYTSEGTLNIPSGTTAQIQGTKRDGNGYSASATISGNTVTVTGHNQMTACAGANIYEISLTNSGKVLNTINFILAVEPAAMDAGTIQSETVLKELQAIIDSAATSTQAAQDAEDAADRAEEAARSLTVDPTLTQSGQPADAKVTGDEINDLKADFDNITSYRDVFNGFVHKTVSGSGYVINNNDATSVLIDAKSAYYIIKASGNMNRFILFGVNTDLSATEVYRYTNNSVPNPAEYTYHNTDYAKILLIVYYGSGASVTVSMIESPSETLPDFAVNGVQVYTKSDELTANTIKMDVTDNITKTILDTNQGKYINSNGTLSDHSEFGVSSFYDVTKISHIKVNQYAPITGGYNVAFYANNDFTTYIEGSGVAVSSEGQIIQIPTNARYVAFCSRRTTAYNFLCDLVYKTIDETIDDIIATNEAKPLAGKKLSILGDSISTYQGYIVSGNNYFYPKNFMDDVSATWWKLLTNKTGLELLINNSYSGATMSGASASSGLSRSENLDDGVSTPDYIIVFMGVNDFASNVPVGECGLNNTTYSVNNFSDAYYTALATISTKYPNAKLYLATIMQYGTAFPVKNSSNVYLTEYNDAIRKLADIFSAHVIEFNKCGITEHNRATTLGDNLHPNKTGQRLMYEEAVKSF